MNFFFKLNEKYALDLTLFSFQGNTGSIQFFKLDIGYDYWKGDHNPKFSFNLELLNITIIDLMVYNMFHVEDDDS